VEFVLPDGHAYPAVQFPEHAGDVSPGVDPNVPTGHGAVHAAVPRPDVVPYSPALQLVHDDAPDRLYVPAGHTDAVGLVDPATHAYPVLQLPEHDADVRPADAPCKPAGHGVHRDAPDRLYVPAGHTDAVRLVDPATHAYPALQFPLQLADVRPADAPYRPALQTVHKPAPGKLYCPAPQIDAVEFVDPAGHAYPALQLPEH